MFRMFIFNGGIKGYPKVSVTYLDVANLSDDLLSDPIHPESGEFLIYDGSN